MPPVLEDPPMCEFFSPSCDPMSFWLFLCISVVLVGIAGLMAGLTMGLLSLDMLNVRILEMEGDPVQKACAKRVLPVLQQHHFLLVSLLLVNAGANEALPIFLSRLVPESVSILVSVTCVLFFGEILPSAIFTGPQQLRIAASLIPAVRVLMVITSPIAYPIAKLLDCWLGGSHDIMRYKRREIKALVALQRETDAMRRSVVSSQLHQSLSTELSPRIHRRNSNMREHSSVNYDPPTRYHAQSSNLHCDEVTIIQGALDLSAKTVRAVMVPIHRVFMLEYNTKVDDNVMADILASGFSRIPIYRDHPSNVVGVLLVKRLIVVDPEDERPVHELALRKPIVVMPDESCYHILNEFQKGRSHIALVTKDADRVLRCWERGIDIPPSIKFDGMLTIEDVIEELIQEEIEDESDVFVQDIVRYWKKQTSHGISSPGGTRISFVQTKLKQLAERARRRVRTRHTTGMTRTHSTSSSIPVPYGKRTSHVEVRVVSEFSPLLSRSI